MYTMSTAKSAFLSLVERIKNQIALLENIPFSAKFGGATGDQLEIDLGMDSEGPIPGSCIIE